MSKMVLLSAVSLSMLAVLNAEEAVTADSEIAVVNIERIAARENEIAAVIGKVAIAKGEIAANCTPKKQITPPPCKPKPKYMPKPKPLCKQECVCEEEKGYVYFSGRTGANFLH